MTSFDKFSVAILFAVFLLYPAFTAASVAFPLMIYSSANLCCFKVNLIYHQLLSIILNTKKTAVKLSLKKKMLVAYPLSFWGRETSIKPAPISYIKEVI